MVWRASRGGFGAARLMMLLVLHGSVLVEGSNGEVRLQATNISHSACTIACISRHTSTYFVFAQYHLCSQFSTPSLNFQARRYVSLSRGRSLLYHELSVTKCDTKCGTFKSCRRIRVSHMNGSHHICYVCSFVHAISHALLYASTR